jgi:DNA-nicking Smr family endonuclease
MSGNTGDDDLWRHYTDGVKAAQEPVRQAPIKKVHALALKKPVGKLKKRHMEKPEPVPAFEARLDLHGCTQTQAYEKLIRFIARQAVQGNRRLLIITGKGREGQSVLHAQVPLWCEAPPLAQQIASVSPAAQQDGGEGAFYVTLRRSSQKEIG